MSNTNSKFIADYIYLAEASYADFSSAETKEDFNNAIVDTYPKNPKPLSFAELVTKNYTVEAHWEDKAGDGAGSLLSDESGFSGTLFRKRPSRPICFGIQRFIRCQGFYYCRWRGYCFGWFCPLT